MEVLMKILAQGPEVLGALLAILGGLKILARYTKSQADDKILAAIEAPVKSIKNLLQRKGK